MKKVLVIGSNGQLGQHLKFLANNDSNSWTFFDRQQADLSQIQTLEKIIGNIPFDVLINAAAYTKVDQAQTETDLCLKINAEAVKMLAQICSQKKASLIHFSTDYVFNGDKAAPYTEKDKTNPLNVYGESKVQSEKHIANSGCDFVVFRTSWVYSHYGNNFYKTIVQLAKQKPLKVLFDQVGTPTFAGDLAETVFNVVKNNFYPQKIYHYSNEGVASWYDFAKQILKFNYPKGSIQPILIHDFPQKAIRPTFSVLSKQLIKQDLNITIPHWCDSLELMSRDTK